MVVGVCALCCYVTQFHYVLSCVQSALNLRKHCNPAQTHILQRQPFFFKCQKVSSINAQTQLQPLVVDVGRATNTCTKDTYRMG